MIPPPPQQKVIVTFLMISVPLFSLHLACLQILRPVFTLLFVIQQKSLFRFYHHYPGNFTFQIQKSSVILIYHIDGIFYESKFNVQRK